MVPTYTPASSYESQPPVYQPPPQPIYEPTPPPAAAPASAPAAPSYETPAAPSYETPAAPSYETPAAPSYSPGAAPVPATEPVKAPTPPSYDATVVGQAYAAQQYSAQPYPSHGYPAGQYPPGQYPGQQYSAPPVSAPYAYAMQAGMVPPLPPKKGRAGIIVLSILTAVFVVATGVLGTLFVMRTSDANDLAAQVTKLDADNKANAAKATSLQKDLDSAKRDLTDSKTQADEMSRQRTVLADCLNAIIDANTAFRNAGNVDTPDVKAKEAVEVTKCNLATKLL